MNNCIDPAADRYKRLSDEVQRDFVSKARKVSSIYMFVLQFTPFKDVDLHKLFVYLRYLLKKIFNKGQSTNNLEDKLNSINGTEFGEHEGLNIQQIVDMELRMKPYDAGSK